MAYNWSTGRNAPASFNWATGRQLPQGQQPKQSLKVSEPINSRAEDYRSPGDNRSPAGETIPAGTGASSYDGKIVFFSGTAGSEGGNNEWVEAINAYLGSAAGGARATFVMFFADCLFTSSFSLLRLYADEQLIISNVAPTRQSGETIRFYDGTQTTPDPVLVAALGSDRASAWPGFCYAVFENFDCSLYGNRVPLIRAVLSGAVTDVAASEEQSTLTFGSFGVGYANLLFAADPIRNWHYQIVNDGSDDSWVVTIDIETLTEINRVPVSGIASYGTIEYPVALYGTDFLAAAITSPSVRPVLLNALTGQIVASLTSTGWNIGPKKAALLTSAGTTKFVVITESEHGTEATPPIGDGSDLGAFIADVTNQTLEWIIHPDTDEAVGSRVGVPEGSSAHNVAFGSVVDGVLPVWYVDGPDDGTTNGVVNLALVSATGFTSGSFYVETVSGKEPRNIAYDYTRNILVVRRADNTYAKLNGTTGALISTHASPGVTLSFNGGWGVGTGPIPVAVHYQNKPGFVIATQATTGDVYELNLDTIAATLLIDRSAFSEDDTTIYFDQLAGVMTEGSDTAGIINKITLGGKTPDVVDLEDIFTQLATFDDRFTPGDLTFSDFAGSETSGFKVENDTTIDNLENSIAELFDVKIVESDAKRKYFYPKRDGSFAVDVTLAAADFIERGPTTIQKSFGAGEDEFAGCTVQYFDIDADYKKLDQTYRRPVGVYDVTRSKKVRSINTVLSLSASQAMELATLAVFRSVLGNETYAFGLVPGKSHVEPADILQFDFSGFTVYGRVKEATLSADYTQECQVYQYLQYAQATFTGGTVNQPEIVPVSLVTRFIYLDVPLLSYAHDQGGTALVQYVQMAGYGSGTINAVTYKSEDGTTYTNVGSKSGVSPVVGGVSAITGYPSDPSVVDETNTITVNITGGDADDITAGDRAAIGRPGRWCVITFDAVSVSGSQATLSDLTWGYDNGSEVWRDQVAVGDLFVLIDSAHYTRFDNPTTLLDDVLFYKAAATGTPLGAVQTYSHAAAGVAETPYAPDELGAQVDGGDIDLSWEYRSRLASGKNPATHGETSLSFEIDIMDGGSPNAVLRTLTATTNAKTYLEADITSDFGSMPGSIEFRVYMMSALVGRGYVGEATISLSGDASAFIADDGATFPMYSAVHSPAFYDETLNKTFVIWEAWNGGRAEQVTGLDHSTGYFSDIEGVGQSFLVDDDHGNPVVVLDHENHLHAFYGSHGNLTPSPKGMKHSSTRWPVDGTALDGSKWAIQPDIAGEYTYPHPTLVGSGFHLFMRKTITASTKHTLVLYKTTALADGVATWGSEATIVDFGADSRVYQGPAILVGTKIHFVATKADNADTIREHVYYFVYDTTNGDLENHDNSTSTASGSLPVSLATANTSYRIFEHTGGNGGATPYLAFDTTGDPFVAFTDGTGSSYDIKVIKRTSGTWGSPVTVANTDSRFNGFALGQLPSLEMELFYEVDPLAAWTRGGNIMRKVRSSGGTWGTAQTILAATDFALGQPNIVRNAHADARVTFAEHRQDSLDSTAGDLRVYLWGAGGLVSYQQEPATLVETEADGNELREAGDIELREDGDDELREVPV